MKIMYVLFPAMAASMSACAASNPELRTVPSVDIGRYMGRWFEIAAIPQKFQKGCTATVATYTLRTDGDVDVLNECRLESVDGRPKSAKGKAWVTDRKTNAKLRVRFFWPFSGAYWIIDLGKDYEYAVVGHPSRKYCWILARSPRMDDAVYEGIIGRLKEQLYDVSLLVRTVQPPP